MPRVAHRTIWIEEPASENESENVSEGEGYSVGMVSGIFLKGASFDLNFRSAVEPDDDELSRAEWEGMGQCAVHPDEPFE